MKNGLVIFIFLLGKDKVEIGEGVAFNTCVDTVGSVVTYFIGDAVYPPIGFAVFCFKHKESVKHVSLFVNGVWGLFAPYIGIAS